MFADIPTFINLPDTPNAYEPNKFLATNADGTQVIFVDPPTGGGGGGSGGSSTFTGLTDTPLSYSTEKDAEVVVNSNEDGLTFSKVQNLPRVTQLEDEDIFKVTDFIKGAVTPPVGTPLSDLDLNWALNTGESFISHPIFDTDNSRYAYAILVTQGTGVQTLHKLDLISRTRIASTVTSYNGCLLYTSPSPRDS